MLSQYVCLPTGLQGQPLLEGTTLIPQEPVNSTGAVESPQLVGVSALGIKFYPLATESTGDALLKIARAAIARPLRRTMLRQVSVKAAFAMYSPLGFLLSRKMRFFSRANPFE